MWMIDSKGNAYNEFGEWIYFILLADREQYISIPWLNIEYFRPIDYDCLYAYIATSVSVLVFEQEYGNDRKKTW